MSMSLTRTNTPKADFYRSQIEGYERDIAFAQKHGHADHASFLKSEIVITKMLLETVLVHGDGFGSGGAGPKNEHLEVANQAAAKARGILKSALGPAYHDALKKGRVDDVAKARDPRSPWDLAAALVTDLKRAPSAARAAGAAARDTLAKANKVNLKDKREATRIRALLQKAAFLRKSARWLKVPPAERRRVDQTERAARQHLAKIEAKQKVRSDAREAAAKHHHAMVARGVTFNRMTQY